MSCSIAAVATREVAIAQEWAMKRHISSTLHLISHPGTEGSLLFAAGQPNRVRGGANKAAVPRAPACAVRLAHAGTYTHVLRLVVRMRPSCGATERLAQPAQHCGLCVAGARASHRAPLGGHC